MWYSVYNQPDRASYLDFGQGVMPIYHGLYLTLMWYMIAMVTLKAIASVFVIDTVFNKYVTQNRVDITLRPLHPDGCCGLSSLGRYALLLHLMVFLQGFSVSARVFFDFVLVGTSIQKQPQLLVGVVGLLFVSPVLFFAPLYIVRGRITTVKQRLLRELNEEYALQRDKFLQMLRGDDKRTDQVEIQTLEYMQKLSEIHAPLANIPSWPFDVRTISTFVGTLFIPAIMPVVLEVALTHFF